MIKNTKKMFMLLIFFLTANNMFCSDPGREKILDRVPQQINVPHELHEIKEELALQTKSIRLRPNKISSRLTYFLFISKISACF